MDSRQLAEFQAYEMVNGPIGSRLENEQLADIHEMLQQIARILISQNAEHSEDIPKVQRYPRPHDVFDAFDEGEDEDAG